MEAFNVQELHNYRVYLVNFLLKQPIGHTLLMYRKFPEKFQRHIRYGYYRHYLDHGGQDLVSKDSIKSLYIGILTCWCCGTAILNCANFNDGEYIVIHCEDDPARVDHLEPVRVLLET